MNNVSLPTPLEFAPEVISGTRNIFLKREDVHPIGSFKWRGAFPTMDAFHRRGVRVVATASTGNHGTATAWAAQQLGMQAVIFVPLNTSATKLQLMERFGGEVRKCGKDGDEAKAAGIEWAKTAGVQWFEDGAESEQFQGYRAIGDEIIDQLPERPGAVLVPLGNGALLVGIARALRERSPQTKIFGVVAEQAPVMAMSLAAGSPMSCDQCDTFADGIATRIAVPRAVAELDGHVDHVVEVSEEALARSVATYHRADMRVEGAGAASLAALESLSDLPEPVVLVISGRNIDEQLHSRLLTAVAM